MHTLQSDRKIIESKKDFIDFQKTLFLVFKKLQKLQKTVKGVIPEQNKESEISDPATKKLLFSDFINANQDQSPTIDTWLPNPAHLRLAYQLLLTTGIAKTPRTPQTPKTPITLEDPKFLESHQSPYGDLDEQEALEKEQGQWQEEYGLYTQFPYPQKIEDLSLIPTKALESIQSLVCIYTTNFEEMIKQGLPPFQAQRYLPRTPASAYFSVENKMDCACDAFRMFNIPEPTASQKACMLGYNGPSLSVGDIVETLDLQNLKAYNFLCQNQGWEARKISPSFDPLQLQKTWKITESQNGKKKRETLGDPKDLEV